MYNHAECSYKGTTIIDNKSSIMVGVSVYQHFMSHQLSNLWSSQFYVLR